MKQSDNIFAGFKIKGLRIKMQYSLAYTAEELDITTPYLSSIENGKKQPSIKVLKKAARLFGVDLISFQESSSLVENIEKYTNKAELAELIEVFETILHKQSK